MGHKLNRKAFYIWQNFQPFLSCISFIISVIQEPELEAFSKFRQTFFFLHILLCFFVVPVILNASKTETGVYHVYSAYYNGPLFLFSKLVYWKT